MRIEIVNGIKSKVYSSTYASRGRKMTPTGSCSHPSMGSDDTALDVRDEQLNSGLGFIESVLLPIL